MAGWLDGVLFTPTLGGTTDWVVSAAVIGYNTPALAGAAAIKYKYHAQSADQSQWEDGEGTYVIGSTTLPRTTVLYNSAGTGTGPGQSGAGTKINFTTVPTVSVVALKEDMISIEENNSFTTTQQDQIRKNIGEFTGGGYSNIVAFTSSGNAISITADAVALFNSSGNIFGATTVSLSLSMISSGANGIDTGSVGTNQYYYFVIYNPTTGTIASLASLSAAAPTMPSGYTYKRRIGWLNYSSGITGFVQRNNQFTWVTPRSIVSGTQTVAAFFSLATLCSPVASRVFGYFVMNNNAVVVQDNGGNAIAQASGIATQCIFQWSFSPSNTTYQVGYSSSSSGGALSLTGWEDNI